jgi:3'-5' exoribonuclease
MIKDLKLKTTGPAKGTFLISDVEFKPFKNKPGNFLSCEFTDMSGTIKGIMWDGVDPLKDWVKSNMVVNVTGVMASYNDAPQLVISTLAKCDVYNSTLLTPSLEKVLIEEIMARLDQQRLKISNETCETIWGAVIGYPKPGELDLNSRRGAFSNCPGGKGEVHHAYCGGLAQHSESMVRIAENMAIWLNLDKDILMTGCLIHDLGKIESYRWDSIIEMTDAGRLLHHTILGYKMLMEIAATYKIPANDITFLKLVHIVISHHDTEGIRKPMFPEAVAVALIDNLDATTMHARDFSRKLENKDPDTNWTKFCQLTGRQYYIPKEVEVMSDEPPMMQIV